MTHAYDNPDLSSVQFLREVMHSREVALVDRVKATGCLAEIECMAPRPRTKGRKLDEPPSLVIKITLPPELEMQVLFKSFPPELQKDLLYLQRCYEQGIEGPFEIGDMPVKGHA